jgi:hypothetical protein
MKLAEADRRKLTGLLEELARAVEELLLSGLTAASEATQRTVNVSFQEASRLRLLRLSVALRQLAEELGRFARKEPEFSHRRLCFFLNRAWLLSHAIIRALREGDEEEFERLIWVPANEPVERVEVVVLGVSKKVAAGSFVRFDFRLRALTAAGPVQEGQRLAWSCVHALQRGAEIPAEAFLHLPQKQKFMPKQLLEHRSTVIENAAVALDEFGGGRVSLGEQSKVTQGEKFKDWKRFQGWDPAAALRRIEAHRVGPFDLEVEMQEEVTLDDWRLDRPGEGPDGQTVYPLHSGGTTFDAVVSPGVEGKALGQALEGLRKKKQSPPLFGLLHFARCRLVLQPLAVFGKDGPVQLMLSDEKIDRVALLKTLKF